MPKNEIILHGTFLSLFGVGTHIMGDPGVGKSELALGLISRQHQLIADDAPLFSKEHKGIYGKNPLKKHFLCLRGIGLLDIGLLFGSSSTSEKHQLNFIIQLQAKESGTAISHLIGEHSTKDILGCLIPCVTIPIITPRNLEIIVETLVKNFLANRNQDPLDSFEELLQKKMELSHL